MSKYINDPREMAITPESGVTYEEDNRIEKMYHWGAKILDLCNMEVSEYMKPMTIIVSGYTPSPTHDPHEYVDLGLKSGILWATCNIGANTPEEAGLYFAWGETQGYTSGQVGREEGKREFTWKDYKWGTPDDGQNPLITDELVENGVLKSDYDAAVFNWGNGWRMPTAKEFEELVESTTTGWTVYDNGIGGVTFTSLINGNTLFFPAVGSAYDGKVADDVNEGYCWSSSFNSEKLIIAWLLYLNSETQKVDVGERYRGRSVRPVRF